MGEPCRPKARFWDGDRTKPRSLEIEITLLGSEILTGVDGFTYLVFEKYGRTLRMASERSNGSHHSSPLITTHHRSSPLTTTHHHSSPLITTHHHSSPRVAGTAAPCA